MDVRQLCASTYSRAKLIPVAETTLFSGRNVAAWTALSVASYVPANADGVVLSLFNGALGVNEAGVRSGGSTDDFKGDFSGKQLAIAIVKLDGSLQFEYCVPGISPNFQIILKAYTLSGGVVLQTNAPEVTMTLNATWETIDLSSSCLGAQAIILQCRNVGAGALAMGARCHGSSDNRVDDFFTSNVHTLVIGCDSAQRINLYREDANVKFYLRGYFNQGVQFNVDAEDVTPGVQDTWTSQTGLPAGALMGFYEIVPDVAGNAAGAGIRGGGESGYLGLVAYRGFHLGRVISGVIQSYQTSGLAADAQIYRLGWAVQ